jgi:hypothetical protein
MTTSWTAGWLAAAAGLALACSGGHAEQRGAGATSQGDAAQPPVTTAAPMPSQPAVEELPEVAGRLTSVSQTELRIQPQGGDEVRLRIDPSTTSIDLDGRQATLNDLTPGTEVRASYEETKGAKQALAVHAKTGDAPVIK